MTSPSTTRTPSDIGEKLREAAAAAATAADAVTSPHLVPGPSTKAPQGENRSDNDLDRREDVLESIKKEATLSPHLSSALLPPGLQSVLTPNGNYKVSGARLVADVDHVARQINSKTFLHRLGGYAMTGAAGLAGTRAALLGHSVIKVGLGTTATLLGTTPLATVGIISGLAIGAVLLLTAVDRLVRSGYRSAAADAHIGEQLNHLEALREGLKKINKNKDLVRRIDSVVDAKDSIISRNLRFLPMLGLGIGAGVYGLVAPFAAPLANWATRLGAVVGAGGLGELFAGNHRLYTPTVEDVQTDC